MIKQAGLDTKTSKPFFDAVKARRSIYGISKEAVISDEKIVDLVQEAVKHTPSSFNSQSARVVVLLGGNHDKFWNLTTETLRKIVPADQFEPTEQKMGAFKSGYGTVLFFEDKNVVDGLMQSFPSYAQNFPIWSQHSSGMHQFVVWTALESEGFGASLQHYNPLVDDEVRSTWNLPDSWQLIAQMPFGKPTAAPGEKQFQPIEDRVKVFK
ncbi:nitroreductase family protein [Paenibacillus alkaliterrae]|uniref:nitroreductase family protein n=1 Tax=Paenibacillus alkaliterrae TaxID=320909 RepID=UPI001F41AC2F|nr:nitroreductase family protein [Paenibacillus alkaliterrae]MCF2939348.1 nitroreductase family protein [Paenibacillus alkaliterrae]